jgi:hypothetical protein
MTRSGVRTWVVAAAVLGTLLFARHAAALSLITFRAPHAVRAPMAHIDSALQKDLDVQARATDLGALDELVAFALGATSRALRFGLSHRTRLTFDGVEREGNCVEYAELFASIVNRERGSADVRAWVVRSDAEILGETAKSPAWKDHDWVLVVAHTPDGPRRLYVDPTLYDMGLGWDISGMVLGDVRSP